MTASKDIRRRVIVLQAEPRLHRSTRQDTGTVQPAGSLPNQQKARQLSELPSTLERDVQSVERRIIQRINRPGTQPRPTFPDSIRSKRIPACTMAARDLDLMTTHTLWLNIEDALHRQSSIPRRARVGHQIGQNLHDPGSASMAGQHG
jgi:hypothetical protein